MPMLRRLGWLLLLVPAIWSATGCQPAARPGADSSPPADSPTEIVAVEGLAELSGQVAIDGSSTVYPVTEAVAEEFQAATNNRVRVTVGVSGTGGGFKKFARGEIDVSAASRPILKSEMAVAAENKIPFVELPVCFDALTVVVNPQNDWVEAITIDDLKKIWEPAAEGKVLKWSDVRPEWPAERMILYGPGADSGTFDYFTEAVVGKAKASRGDFTPSEDDNTLVQGVEGSRYALGYFGYAYYEANQKRLKALKIIPPGKNEGVAPSPETVLSGAYTPLSRPLFIYVNREAAERPEVRKFCEFYLRNVPALAKEVAYIPLPPEAYTKALARLAKLEVGTAFGGEAQVGVPIEEILSRPLIP